MAALSPILRSVAGGGLAWFCPGCDIWHQVGVANETGPRWIWEGGAEQPTFSPSVLTTWTHGPDHEPRRCHCFIRAGRIEFLSDCTHALASQTVPIPPHGDST